MVNLELTIGTLGIAVVLILWGLDKLIGDDHPELKKALGVLYLLVGLFWLYITLVVVTST